MKTIIKKFLKIFNLSLTKSDFYENLKKDRVNLNNLEFLSQLKYSNFQEIYNHLKISKSELKQDFFVLEELNYKRNGFFIEFGACNGIDYSNTYILEKYYNWDGILAEPSKSWHKNLTNNRNCKIEKNCVWTHTGKLIKFNEVKDNIYSTVESFSFNDDHKNKRMHGNYYNVETISLNDLLKKHNAPKNIDYLSIDTEGSEYEILKEFHFNEFDIKIITCEHNYTINRNKIFNLLKDNGYQRVFEKLSKHDDWYIKL